MNRENMRRLADLIEFEDRFEYANWLRIPGVRSALSCEGNPTDHSAAAIDASRLGECNTAGCVAGWAAYAAVLDGLNPRGKTVSCLAEEWLDINIIESGRLFYGEVMLADDYDADDDDDAYRSAIAAIMADTTAVEIAKVLRQIADGEREL